MELRGQEEGLQKNRSSSPKAIMVSSLQTLEHIVVPQLRESVKAGNGPFGAAILNATDLSLVTASVNRVKDISPLLHAETNCIQEFYSQATRPEPKDCIFLSTHEPCSMCLSAIARKRFPQIYFLFSYEETRDRLNDGLDREILDEVFRVQATGDTDDTLRTRAPYNKSNRFWTAWSMEELCQDLSDENDRTMLAVHIKRLKELFEDLGG